MNPNVTVCLLDVQIRNFASMFAIYHSGKRAKVINPTRGTAESSLTFLYKLILFVHLGHTDARWDSFWPDDGRGMGWVWMLLFVQARSPGRPLCSTLPQLRSRKAIFFVQIHYIAPVYATCCPAVVQYLSWVQTGQSFVSDELHFPNWVQVVHKIWPRGITLSH